MPSARRFVALVRRARPIAGPGMIATFVVSTAVVVSGAGPASASAQPSRGGSRPASSAVRAGPGSAGRLFNAGGATGAVPASPRTAPARWVRPPHPEKADVVDGAESTNWSGEFESGATFTAVQGEWIVPTVAPSSALEYSSTWVGIDGATNSSLIQTGTEQDSGGGGTGYFAWYEILPSPAVEIPRPVSPGDEMDASVTEEAPGSWEIMLKDLTADWSTSGRFSYGGPGASAEWIEEAPTVDNAQSALADFGSVGFSDAASTVSSGSPAMTPVSMVNADGVVIASPGSFDPSTDSFTITYVAPSQSSSTLHITTGSLPGGTLKARYSTSLGASGGNLPYKWSVVAGALPRGLHLKRSSGVIQGKPTERGTFTFTVKVVDKKVKTRGHPATQSAATGVLSITIQ